MGTYLHFHWLRNGGILIRKQDSQDWPQDDPASDNQERSDDDGDIEELLALDHDPSSKFDVDKPAEDDGGVEDQSEGPECDPERRVVDTVILSSSKVMWNYGLWMWNLQKELPRKMKKMCLYLCSDVFCVFYVV